MRFRCSSSVEAFGKRIEQAWGISEWLGVDEETNEVIFFGLYNPDDYDCYRTFQGKRSVFWCGSDILNLKRNSDFQRILRLFPAKHYCENELELKELESLGIKVEAIVPSFLDNINNYPASYKQSQNPNIFICGHNGRENEYGLDVIRRIADRVPDATFHIYGIDKENPYFEYSASAKPLNSLVDVDTEFPNIWYHGKVPEGQFNNEITQCQCGLRTNEHDGFSEVTAKSVLMGQYPISRIPYEKIWNYTNDDELVALIEKLKFMILPNLEARAYYIKTLNQYPFLEKKKFSE